MSQSSQSHPARSTAARRRRRFVPAAALAATAALAIAAGSALAGGATRIVTATGNASLGKSIVVGARGRTLYVLHPETVHHLLCESRACLETWTPLAVHSASTKISAGSGIEGHLGVVRRGAGKFQVTLRGMPLYYFSGDRAKGDANGEGIKSFGGTWHAVPSHAHSATPSPPPAPQPYGY